MFSQFITLSGWFIGFVSLVYAFAQRKRKRLCYDYETNVLVTNKLSDIEGIEILLKNEKVNQLSVTSIEITNNGNTIIEDNDVYEGHKLRIVPRSDVGDIIYSKLVYESSDYINSSIATNKDSVEFRFNSLEKSDCVVVNVYHTGGKSAVFEIVGKIKEGKIYSFGATKFDTPPSMVIILGILLSIMILGREALNNYYPLNTTYMQIINFIICIIMLMYLRGAIEYLHNYMKDNKRRKNKTST